MDLFDLLANRGVTSFFYFPDEKAIYDSSGKIIGVKHHKKHCWVVYTHPHGPALEKHKIAIRTALSNSEVDTQKEDTIRECCHEIKTCNHGRAKFMLFGQPFDID
ncbi:hypothetical protein ACO3BK_001779 [Klebsiella pneumoniae]|uniref:hypothetical protein n=1 Tax=Klebsiella pneumoniae TaxID=573 RepID=UPI0007CBCACC|nr:hypothetical protein [Klebsiella pneumoniae]EKT9722833.1 hypothetical protein [Klebsiella pneumoniae]EKW6092689.1 hypothetical protein [Klebsiella pneumoniae]MEB6137233.1 hypothetical protein [Klebsiella pneumoniae]SBH92378.1 Uncharacterised protein [Klebsiella pneumoniae]HBR0584872.1 hypothetical protein [Klebsiella pneumoniae]